MTDTPYYKQNYHETKSDIPDPKFGQIMKDFFLAPFTWNARSTRKEFWVGYAVQFVLTNIIGVLMVLTFFLFGTVDTENTGWTPPVARVTITVIVLEIIFTLLLIWLKLGLLGSVVRRLHDTNHEGWWAWLYFIPFGWIFTLYFMILPTLEEPVRWNGYLFDTKD